MKLDLVLGWLAGLSLAVGCGLGCCPGWAVVGGVGLGLSPMLGSALVASWPVGSIGGGRLRDRERELSRELELSRESAREQARERER
eukprot:15456613-Alexandrium_andersonii.AAC.1